LVEEHVTKNLQRLLSSAAADADGLSSARVGASAGTDVATAAGAGTGASSTMMAGALTLALAHINKQVLAYAESNGGVAGTGSAEAAESRYGSGGSDDSALRTLQSRILVVSVSSDVASQYIPIMNCVFAAQRKVAPPLTPLIPFFSLISLFL
jgi:transcription initiation factor TFIIH subunit 3